ncbi:MAG: hypothetical protein QW409_02995 [Candidatus Aenigmatarchaeota archaeon]
MLRLERFKLQVVIEYYLGISFLLLIFLALAYAYIETQRSLEKFLDYYVQQSNCYYISSLLNSLFPLTIKNISYTKEFFIQTKYEITVKNYIVNVGNVSCLSKIESVNGTIKNGKNLIIVENGYVKII